MIAFNPTTKLKNQSETPFRTGSKKLKSSESCEYSLRTLRNILNILSESKFDKCWARVEKWINEEPPEKSEDITAIAELLFQKVRIFVGDYLFESDT